MIHEGSITACAGRLFVDADAETFDFIVDLTGDADESEYFTVCIIGDGAAEWAENDQSCEGSRWESDGDDFAYCSVQEKEDRAAWAEEYFGEDEHVFRIVE